MKGFKCGLFVRIFININFVEVIFLFVEGYRYRNVLINVLMYGNNLL